MFAIAMVLLLFVLSLLIIAQQIQQKDYLEASDLALEECHYFATAASVVSASGSGTEKVIELSQDANVISGFVKVSQFICKIEADANNAVLKKGTIKMVRSGAKIGFTQITTIQ